MTATHTLILMRHAKSDYPGGVRDHDRPLTGRGRRDAAAAAGWLHAQAPAIQEVLCSTAERTRETVEQLGLRVPVRFAAEIYDGTPDDILREVAATHDDVSTLLVVGHAPGIPGLTLELAGEDSDLELLDAVMARFPTAATAVLRCAGPWDELDSGGAVLTGFYVPGAGG